MSSANERAEAILIVIKRILKWIAIAIAVIAGVITVFVQYSDWQYDKYLKAEQDLKDKVIVNAVYPEGKDCQEGYPYLYTVVNKTDRTVKKVTFEVEVMRTGFSKTLNEITKIEEDKILKPNEGYGRCFRVISNVDFKTQVTEKEVTIGISRKEVDFGE